MTIRRRLGHTFRKLSSVRSQSSSLRQPPHSSLYSPQKVTMFRLNQCKSSPISLQKCLSSPCVPVLLILLIQGRVILPPSANDWFPRSVCTSFGARMAPSKPPHVASRSSPTLPPSFDQHLYPHDQAPPLAAPRIFRSKIRGSPKHHRPTPQVCAALTKPVALRRTSRTRPLALRVLVWTVSPLGKVLTIHRLNQASFVRPFIFLLSYL